MTEINFATATKAELEAAGFTVTRKPSSIRRTRKSLWGVKPTINKARHASAKTLANADQNGVNGDLRG